MMILRSFEDFMVFEFVCVCKCLFLITIANIVADQRAVNIGKHKIAYIQRQ